MNHKTVAAKFVQGATKATGFNMFVAQPSYHLTIYSYGYHFPIAVRTGVIVAGREIVLFNSNGYSVSTSKHKSIVHWALSQTGDFWIIEAPTAVLKTFSQYSFTVDLVDNILKDLKERTQEAIGKRDRARKYKWIYEREIVDLTTQAQVALQLLNGDTHEFRSQYPL